MRLNKELELIATDELIWLLSLSPQGKTTTELMGTPKFHGRGTLSPRQIARLLRASSLVKHQYDGFGCRAASRWILIHQAN
jgi:hypothetical protein